jgi:trehalose 6-phosphate synthase/phosphatase
MHDKFKAVIIEKFKNARNKLILLDYDGTLVEYASMPELAVPSDELRDILSGLSGKPATTVIIISGRSTFDMDRFLGHLSLNIIAEHGAIIKENGLWNKQMVDDGIWKTALVPLLNQLTLKCPGSFIEEKYFSLAWHYRNAEPRKGYVCSRELLSDLADITQIYNLKILDGNKVVEIMRKDIGKGNAVRKILEKNNFDYILSVGDDVTDEEIFKLFPDKAFGFTIRVGTGSTLAKYKFDNVSEVLLFLKHLSE